MTSFEFRLKASIILEINKKTLMISTIIERKLKNEKISTILEMNFESFEFFKINDATALKRI